MTGPRRVNRDFLLGLVSGILVTLAALLIGAYVSRIVSGDGALFLSEPDLPAEIPVASSPSLDYSRVLRTPGGRSIPLSAFRDHAVFLCFFASWCPPCKAELPSIRNLRARLKSVPNARVLLLTQEDPETVRAFLREQGAPLPILIDDGSVARRFDVNAIPVTFLLDREGRAVFRHDGAARWDGDAVTAFVRELAGEGD